MAEQNESEGQPKDLLNIDLSGLISKPTATEVAGSGYAPFNNLIGSLAGLFPKGIYGSADWSSMPQYFTTATIVGSREALALEETAKLRRENAVKEVQLQQQAESLRTALDAKSATASEVQTLKSRIKDLSRDFEELQKQKDLGYLLERVCPAAADRLLKDQSLVKCFEEAKTCDAFVVSIDIRRSTDLMLRGKTPQLYAEFLDATCTKLVEEIKNNFGVIDKFTGDGLLAYFPLFFAGQDAGYRTLAVAQACHKAFAELYRSERHRFSVALKDVGLGIGIDFGPVHLCRVTRELSVVGSPVVYACRFSGAPAGHTYMNISALAELEKRCPRAVTKTEVEFDVKHEGTVLCYGVTLADSRYEPAPPDWLATFSAQSGSDAPKVPPAPNIGAKDIKTTALKKS